MMASRFPEPVSVIAACFDTLQWLTCEPSLQGLQKVYQDKTEQGRGEMLYEPQIKLLLVCCSFQSQCLMWWTCCPACSYCTHMILCMQEYTKLTVPWPHMKQLCLHFCYNIPQLFWYVGLSNKFPYPQFFFFFFCQLEILVFIRLLLWYVTVYDYSNRGFLQLNLFVMGLPGLAEESFVYVCVWVCVFLSFFFPLCHATSSIFSSLPRMFLIRICVCSWQGQVPAF